MDKVKERTGIYHEHQQGALCAQHALNNLVQTPVFSADNLADIARELDKEENNVLTHTIFESENMDDTGFFNIQVLQLALKMFDLELISYASQEDIAKQARTSPQTIQAYICNLGLHWFTIRRFGRQYFNLNSFYYVPELVPDQQLTVYLNFIKENGYSVFIVHGSLPDCLADQQLTTNPMSMREYIILTKDLPKLVMDDKVMDGSQTVRVPKELFDEYQKNPNDPQIKQKIMAYAPKHLIDDQIPTHMHTSNPQHNHSRYLLLLSGMSKDNINEQIKHCNCPKHRHLRQVLTENLEKPMIDNPLTNNLNEPRQGSHIITEYISEYIIEQPQPNSSNKSQQQRMAVTRQMIVVNRSSHGNNTLVDNHGVQRASITNMRFENEEDDIWEDMVSDYLLDPSAIDVDADISFDMDRTEKLNEQRLKAAIAASLKSNNSETKQVEKTPESIPITTKNSSSILTMNSERTPTINSSLTSTMNSSQTPTISSERIPMVNSERTPTINLPPSSTTAMNLERTSTINSEQQPTINSSPAPAMNSEQTSMINSSPAPNMDSKRIPMVNLEQTPTINSSSTPTMNLSPTPAVNSERILTQNIIEEPKPDNSNKSQQQGMEVTRQMIIINRSSQRNNTSIDNLGVQRMTIPNIGFGNDEDDIWQDRMPDYLLDPSIINTDANISFNMDHIEKLNQQNLEAAIAASLKSNNSETKQVEETPESIPITTKNPSPIPTINSEQTPIINSERIAINNPTSYSSPSTNTNSPSPTIMSSFRSNRIRSLINRRSNIPIEQLSLYSCLYHIRPYCSSSTTTIINEICLRRLLKSNYSCQFQESNQISEHKLLPNKSTFILGHYMLTLLLNNLRLYIINKNNLILIGEDLFTFKIVFIGICTYSDFQNRNFFKQDGFILMTADQRLFLYDFKLKLRMPSNGICFQCEIPVKFLEKSFEYHEHTHMISIHTRYIQRSHLFILLRIWPHWLSYVFLIEPHIFGNDLKQATITHELLIVQNQRNSCNLYSLHAILDEYTIKSHSINDHPNELLPINVLITSCPTCLFTFNCERPLFDYAFCSTQHFLTRINEDYFILNINNNLTPILNGHLKRSWTDNLSPHSQVYFIDTKNNHDCIIDIRESIVHVWQLIHNELTSIKHLYTIDDGITTIITSNNRHITRYGRQIKPQNILDLSSTVITDHYFDIYNNLLTLLFESEVSDIAIIRVIEHPIGICRQDIHFKKNNKHNQLKIMHEHDKLIVQELSCHTVILRLFTLERSR
ncbi:unnamed protein product [Rotaria sordida]|uniref:ubiquitinyl hydrolase 1 n=1 Tax=Rotaria sordida TaxID=392033 RepID=A0A813SYM2_9BILA|nr:unnamed protein product [Rotaria sordida]